MHGVPFGNVGGISAPVLNVMESMHDELVRSLHQGERVS